MVRQRFFSTPIPLLFRALRQQTALVFDKIGDTYFLSKVFLQGYQGGNQLPKSKMQRRLEENGSIAREPFDSRLRRR